MNTIKIDKDGRLEMNGFNYCYHSLHRDYPLFIRFKVNLYYQIRWEVFYTNTKWHYRIIINDTFGIVGEKSKRKSKGYKTALEAINQCNKQINY
jgi:hypothetical protein